MSEITKIAKHFDLVVVGGGISGICTAISAARNGVHTALIQNRTMLGGNASSEMRVHVNGAARDGSFRNAIESGIVLELLMANKKVNHQDSYHVFDNVLWEKVKFQENLELYLSTEMLSVETEGNKITQVTARQSGTETEFIFTADYFSDDTGDGTLAYLAGADYTIGHEARATYNESLAPEEANEYVMGSSVLFSMKDMGKPMPFKRPFWAYEYTKEMRGKRRFAELTHGYWWIELDGEISESDNIRTELMKYAYGVFDYIKNSGDLEGTENLVLDWVSGIAGKRESRRIYGDYMLNQNDIDNSARFEDAIGYGGWSMDDHSIGGIRNTNPEDIGTIFHPVDDIYTIPYRCIYSRNIDNLFIGGRCFSASHMALSSARVMSTGATLGQAAGVAASIALREKITPRAVGEQFIHELQQTLIRDDCYLPGIKAQDTEDVVVNKTCTISASSETTGGEASNINGDFARRIDDKEYAWISQEMSEDGEWIAASFAEAITPKHIILRFDPNFSRTLIPTQSWRTKARQVEDMPYELIKDYTLVFEKDGEVVLQKDVTDNFQRVNTHEIDDVCCDTVKLIAKATYGDAHARLFDMRIYE